MERDTTQNEAFLSAYDSYADAIFRHCYFRVYDRERARELMQECFMKTWEYISSGKQVANIRAFLYRVANNLVIDSSRKKKESSLDELMEQGFDVAQTKVTDAVIIAEAAHALDRIKEIDDQYREVIVMRYVDGLTPKEIAHILNETENAVSVRIHRGMKALRKLLAIAPQSQV